LPEKIIADAEITGRRMLTLSTRSPGTLDWQKFKFFVDGKSFDPDRVDHRIRLGAVEEWTIVNQDSEDDHVFHIHVNDMLLTKINGEPLADPIWLDTAIVPRKGSITFRSRFLDFTGKFVLHCHMMNHEDLGMMQVVEVYAANQ
jgi:FtsP/CotA-like multicopper oxidase with cupredoxin domain